MTSTPSKITTCNCCSEQFSSRNAYFKHQRDHTCVCGFHSDSASFEAHTQACTKVKTLETRTLQPSPPRSPRSPPPPPCPPPSETTIVNDSLSKLNSKSTVPEIISAYNNLINNLTNLYVPQESWNPYGCSNGISKDDIDMILYQSEKNLLSKLNLEAISD